MMKDETLVLCETAENVSPTNGELEQTASPAERSADACSYTHARQHIFEQQHPEGYAFELARRSEGNFSAYAIQQLEEHKRGVSPGERDYYGQTDWAEQPNQHRVAQTHHTLRSKPFQRKDLSLGEPLSGKG